jgi:glutamine amidotransferase
MKLAIVDYGMGNLHSLVGAINHVSQAEVLVTSNPNELEQAAKLFLPGVGHFAEAMLRIKKKKIDVTLKKLVVEQGRPILGICLGMQILGKSSDEGGNNNGLSFVDGYVEKFHGYEIRVPHVGYNQVMVKTINRLYRNLPDNSDFYFTHSHRMKSNSNIGQSSCEYGDLFVASFEYENIAGVQFHPELSQKNGLSLIKNFIEIF